MKKFWIFLLIIAALQACGWHNSQRGMDQGSYDESIPPSYAHPAGGTMGIEP